MEKEIIHRIRVKTANAWLVSGQNGWMVMDSGPPGCAGTFFKGLKSLGIPPQDIRLAVATHVHFDHVGNLARIREASGCKILAPEKEAHLIEKGAWVLPGPTSFWTGVAIGLGKRMPGLLQRVTRYRPFPVDIYATGPLSLAPYGFDAVVLPTPGHTPGSVSILTAQGNAFVGDLAYNELPWLRHTVSPPFIMDQDAVFVSWNLLLQKSAKTIHPGHGACFDARLMEKALPLASLGPRR